MISVDRIREDFDRIALLTEKHGTVNDTYYTYLSSLIPRDCKTVLEVGCGVGQFTRILSTRAQHVIGFDVSPQMIRLARQQSSDYQNIEYVLGDIMQLSIPPESSNCIVTISTLHHLPLEPALSKMKKALSPGGLLVIHDLLAPEGIVELTKSVLAYPASLANRFWRSGHLRPPRELREAWTKHGAGEDYLTLSRVRQMCRQYLPGATVHRHFLWRYTVVWKKG